MLSSSTSPLRFLGYAADLMRTRLLRQSRTFQFGEARLKYLDHSFNWTWTNERCVEVPIGIYFVRQFAGRKILEVGNVLGHYGIVGHTVVDKYEQAPGVENQDVLEIEPERQFDLIISLSTLEHVGFDELPADPQKPIRAVGHLIECLAPGGLFVASMPLGYNPHLDAGLLNGGFPFTGIHFLSRTTRANDWEEVRPDQVIGAEYNHPYPAANALAVGFVRRT